MKNNKHITKKGSFLDDEYMFSKGKPGPQAYNVDKKWVSDAAIEKGKKLPKNTKRNTFIEEIFHEQSKRGVPGPGKYNVEKSTEDLIKAAETLDKKIKYDSF